MPLQGVYLRMRILPIYRILVRIPKMGLPPKFEDIRIINMYNANGFLADNWESELANRNETWIITQLHYSKSGRRRAIRKTSGDRSWNARQGKEYKTSTLWREVPYKLTGKPNGKSANRGNELPKYTMIELTPKEERPEYALCKITRRSQEDAQKQDNRSHLFRQGTTQNQSNDFKVMAEMNYNQNAGDRHVIVNFGRGDLLMPPTAVLPQNAITVQPASGSSNSQEIASPYEYNTSIREYNQRKNECILDHPSTDGLLLQWNSTKMVTNSLGPTASQLVEPQLDAIANNSIYTAPHNEGLNSTMTNFPTNNSFPTAPEFFGIENMNPTIAIEQGSPRSISGQLIDAQIFEASPDGFMGIGPIGLYKELEEEYNRYDYAPHMEDY